MYPLLAARTVYVCANTYAFAILVCKCNAIMRYKIFSRACDSRFSTVLWIVDFSENRKWHLFPFFCCDYYVYFSFFLIFRLFVAYYASIINSLLCIIIIYVNTEHRMY